MSHNVKQILYNVLLQNPLTSREKSDLDPRVFRSYKIRIPSYRFSVGSFSRGGLAVPPNNSNPAYYETRQNLPIAPYRNEILQTIEYNQIIVIVGETGSGKTTQIPQYILEDCTQKGRACRIFCTQPRRLAALSVADRVVQERGETIGATVGYQIRLESRTSPTSSLIYSTVGLFLRCLMSEDENAFFGHMTHIIVDEVHERDKYTDFLLTTLKRTILKYPHVRLILMSATIESEAFSKYFFECPILKLPGRMFEVTTYFLEDVLMLLYNKSNDAPLPNATKTDEELYNSSIDSETNEAMNETLENCVRDPLNCFPQLFYLIEGENIPVDYRHPETDMTALMIASCQGNFEAVNRLLSLGANPELKSRQGLNSINWASHLEKHDCVNLLKNFMQDKKSDSSQANELLAEYQQSRNSDIIDRNLIYDIIKHIHKNEPEGSILVFLPGYDDIIELNDIIYAGIIEQELDAGILLYLLHSNMSTVDQKNVFHPVQYGCRKVILSTNISETSVTIDDVIYVIDCGKVKQKGFDSISGTTSLSSTWISKACATQRAGRAGRTRPGKCYRIYSKYRYDSFDKFTVPEILRIPLTDICLQAKLIAQTIPIADFLGQCIQPPTDTAIRRAISTLQAVGGLDEYENLTDLGAQLVDLPIDVQLGKILIYSIIFRCLDPVLTIVSTLSVKDPFILPSDSKDRHRAAAVRKEFAEDSYSDHMVMLRMFQQWLNKKSMKKDRQFCREKFLSNGNLDMMSGVRSQILGYLRAVGLVQSQGPGNIHDVNRNSQNWPIVKACLVAGMYPNICKVDPFRTKLTSKFDNKVLLHRSSVSHEKGTKSINLPTDWVIYGEKIRIGSNSFIQTNTVVTPLTIALFGGPLIQSESDVLTSFRDDESLSDVDTSEFTNSHLELTNYQLDDWICFSLPTQTAYMIFNIRQKMNALVLKFISNPRNFAKTDLDSNIISTVAEILLLEDVVYNLRSHAGIGERPKAVVQNYISHFSPVDQSIMLMTNTLSQMQVSDNPSTSGNKHLNQNYSKIMNRPITKTRKSRHRHNNSREKNNACTSKVKQRFFIVKAASRVQILNIFGTDKWEFSSSTLKKIFKIARVSYLLVHTYF